MPLDGKNYTDDLTDTEKAARDDLFLWLDRFPARVPALLEAVREGRMNGSQYLGYCKCVKGHLGNGLFREHSGGVVDCSAVEEIAGARCDDEEPIETFVYYATPGNTPANSPTMARLEEWIMQWQAA